MIQTNPITKTNNNIVASADTSKSKTGAVKGVSTNSTSNKQTFCDYRAKVGETIYSLSEGQILSFPWKPYARLSTKRLSEVRFLIRDPTATEYSRISENDDVRVEIGFHGGKPTSKFVGKVKNKGRVEPSSTFIIAVDNLATLSQSMGSSVINASDPVQKLVPKTVSESGRKVVATNSGVLAKINRQDGDKTARGTIYQSSVAILAHSKLAFDTDVRIECRKTKKRVTIKINDRPPSASGFAGSAQLLKDLGISELISGECKFEVLAPPGAETTPTTDADKASKTEGIPEAQRIASAVDPDKLKYAQRTSYDADKPGSATLQQSPGKAMVANAAARGDSVLVSGNTVIEVSAHQSQQESTGLVLNYATQRDTFKGDPIFSKRSPLQLTSGTGTITVQGWNSNTKESISATVTSPGAPDLTVGLKIFPSPTGPIEVAKPIYPSSQYTWGDATKEGTRIPKDKTIFQNIIEIAQIIDKYTIEVNKGKWQVTSWYRDPLANRAAGGASNSSHLEGLAVDAFFEGYRELHAKLYPAYPYGLAVQPKKNGFIHLDSRKGGKRRWTYPTKKR